MNATWKSAVIRAMSGWSARMASAMGWEEGRHEHDADQPVDQVADRQPIARRVAAAPALDQRIDGAAEVRAQHQGQRGRRGDDRRVGQRHDQEHARDTRMGDPSEQRREQDAHHRIARDGAQQHPHAGRALGRLQRSEQDMQRQQHLAQPDGDATQVLDPLWDPLRNATTPTMNRAGAAAATLNERICTMRVVPTLAPSRIARPETRPTTPCAVNEAVISAVAVLVCSSVVRPSPAANAANRLPSAFDSRWRRSEPKARRMPLLDHMQAPQQQRDATHQVKQDNRSHGDRLTLSAQCASRHYRQAAFRQSSPRPPAINANARTKLLLLDKLVIENTSSSIPRAPHAGRSVRRGCPSRR